MLVELLGAAVGAEPDADPLPESVGEEPVMVAAEEGEEPVEAELDEPALFVCEGDADCRDDETSTSNHIRPQRAQAVPKGCPYLFHRSAFSKGGPHPGPARAAKATPPRGRRKGKRRK